MSEIKGLTIFILLTTLVTVTRTQEACIESKLCYCQNSDSTFIDLNPIGAKRLQAKKGLHTYELQLCEPFDLQGGCIGVYGCQIRQILPNYVSLGNTAHFTESINITYTGGDSITIVQLLCNSKVEATFDFLNESPKKTFNFLLQSKYACAQSFPTTTALPASDSTQDTTQTDSTAESGESTTATSELTTEASESTAATSESTTEASESTAATSESTTEASESTAATSESTTDASEPTGTASDRTTGESEATTAASESTTDASGATSEATVTTAASATTDTTPTTTHGGAGSLSTLTLGTIILLALLSRTLL